VARRWSLFPTEKLIERDPFRRSFPSVNVWLIGQFAPTGNQWSSILKLPLFNARTWTKIRGPMITAQLFLIVMAAIGQLDFFRQVYTYFIECMLATLFVVVFYSSTLRIAFQTLMEWFVKSFSVLVAFFFVFMMFQKSGSIPLDTIFDKLTEQNVLSPIVIAVVYCVMHFSSAWMSSRRTSQPKQQFFVTALYPASLEPLALSLLVMAPISGIVSHVIGERPSVVAARVTAVTMTAVFGLTREYFSYLMFALLTKDVMIRGE
jgi:hypothetical protein